MSKIMIAPSILSADFGQLNSEIKSIEEYVDYIHVDVMDGHFVPNLTIGPVVVQSIKSKKPLDVHLMISEPEKYIDAFVKAGASNITIHAEVKESTLKLIKHIKKHGIMAGISINPDTAIDPILPYLKDIDIVLIMSVFPGFGGQEFMPEILEKIRMIANAKKINRAKKLIIEVDGGINDKIAPAVIEAGANLLVSGSYIFGAKDRIAAIHTLKGVM